MVLKGTRSDGINQYARELPDPIPPTPPTLPNLLENRLTPYAFITVGGVGGAAHATGLNRLALHQI